MRERDFMEDFFGGPFFYFANSMRAIQVEAPISYDVTAARLLENL